MALKHALTHPHLFAMAVVSAIGWDRVALVVALVVGMTVLTAVGKVDGSASVGFFSAVVGYVLGRGSSVNPPPNGVL